MAMSSLVRWYTEHVAMRVKDAVTASGSFSHSLLASLISLLPLQHSKDSLHKKAAASLTLLRTEMAKKKEIAKKKVKCMAIGILTRESSFYC